MIKQQVRSWKFPNSNNDMMYEYAMSCNNQPWNFPIFNNLLVHEICGLKSENESGSKLVSSKNPKHWLCKVFGNNPTMWSIDFQHPLKYKFSAYNQH